MTRTKSTFKALEELHENFKPATRGIVTDAEAAQVSDILELDARTDLEIQDARDMSVMLYGKWADLAEKNTGIAAMMDEMDAMSAVCAVIDREKTKRGMPV